MFDLPGITEADKARDNFLSWFGVAMLAVFAFWNIGLGIGGLRSIDLVAVDLAGGVFDRPWTAIEAKYGPDLAEFAYLAKIRILMFVLFELLFVLMFLLLSGLWQPFLTSAPTSKDETQSLIGLGDLRSVRGYTQWEWFLRTHPVNMIPSRGKSLPRAGVKSAYVGLIIVFLGMLVFLIATPIWTPDFSSRGRRGPEMDVLLLAFSALMLVWLAPVFLVTALRFLSIVSDREKHSPQ